MLIWILYQFDRLCVSNEGYIEVKLQNSDDRLSNYARICPCWCCI